MSGCANVTVTIFKGSPYGLGKSRTQRPGCRVLVRMAMDACHADGTLAKLKRPLHIITGLQFEPLITALEGDVVIYGDCAKKMCQYFPHAKFYGSTEEYPGCSPTWSNIPGIGLADHIRSLI